MTKDEFLELQVKQCESGVSLMKYLRDVGLSYSTYTYWNRKFRTLESDDLETPFARVTLRSSTAVSLPSCAGHITLQFPNGVHIRLDSGMEEIALRLITSYPYGYVLP